MLMTPLWYLRVRTNVNIFSLLFITFYVQKRTLKRTLCSKKELNSSLLFLDILVESTALSLSHLCAENPPLLPIPTS